ncbi:hypothetical protein [Ideonella paludis]|uniref:hypothetical protein n=1 Tax=Ideonella paludis TaxID=1233411 RepID=UPI0036281040
MRRHTIRHRVGRVVQRLGLQGVAELLEQDPGALPVGRRHVAAVGELVGMRLQAAAVVAAQVMVVPNGMNLAAYEGVAEVLHGPLLGVIAMHALRKLFEGQMNGFAVADVVAQAVVHVDVVAQQHDVLGVLGGQSGPGALFGVAHRIAAGREGNFDRHGRLLKVPMLRSSAVFAKRPSSSVHGSFPRPLTPRLMPRCAP